MKLKKLLSIMGLGLFAGVSAFAGVTLAKDAKGQQVDADEHYPWMFRAMLNLDVASPNSEGCVIEPEHAVDGVQFHYWGDNVDTTVDAKFVATKTFDYFAANISLAGNQVIRGAQWILHQKDLGYKYSIDIDRFGDSAVTELEDTSDILGIEWQFANNWTGESKWEFTGNLWGYPLTSLKLHNEDAADSINMVKNPASNAFEAKNVTCTSGKWIEMVAGGGAQMQNFFYDIIDEQSQKYRGTGGNQWFTMRESGTFDFFLSSNKITIKKHSDPASTYIYYATESADPTEHYIYAYGACTQYGEWPGTKITEIDSVEEVTGKGVMHFQGKESAVLIYKIPFTLGYPDGDDHFIINNNGGSQTDNKEVVAGAAYWWTSDANKDAGLAIDFLVDAEIIRNAATYEGLPYSACGISKEHATALVNGYNAASDEVRGYIDPTTVFTYNPAKKASEQTEPYDETMVSYRDIMLLLADKYELELAGSAPRAFGNGSGINNPVALIVVITLVAVTSITLTSVVVITQKRKEN